MGDWDFGRGAIWALDFVRALRERPKIMRLLFRWAVGKYAYREFTGLVNELQREDMYPDFDYGLEECSYHRDETPLDWVDSLYVEGE